MALREEEDAAHERHLVSESSEQPLATSGKPDPRSVHCSRVVPSQREEGWQAGIRGESVHQWQRPTVWRPKPVHSRNASVAVKSIQPQELVTAPEPAALMTEAEMFQKTLQDHKNHQKKQTSELKLIQNISGSASLIRPASAKFGETKVSRYSCPCLIVIISSNPFTRA